MVERSGNLHNDGKFIYSFEVGYKKRLHYSTLSGKKFSLRFSEN